METTNLTDWTDFEEVGDNTLFTLKMIQLPCNSFSEICLKSVVKSVYWIIVIFLFRLNSWALPSAQKKPPADSGTGGRW
jgi:hypothetical protein